MRGGVAAGRQRGTLKGKKPRLVLGLDHELQVIGLHRDLTDPRAEALRRGEEGAAHLAEELARAQARESTDDVHHDV